MVEYFFVRDFYWFSEKEILEFDILNVDKDVLIGYILEVIFEYLRYLYDEYNDFFLVLELFIIKVEELFFYCRNLYKSFYKQKISGEIFKKFVFIFNIKEKYVVYYRNL